MVDLQITMPVMVVEGMVESAAWHLLGTSFCCVLYLNSCDAGGSSTDRTEDCSHPHFRDQETKAQRSEGAFSRSHVPRQPGVSSHTVLGKHRQLDASCLLVSAMGVRTFSSSLWAQSPSVGVRFHPPGCREAVQPRGEGMAVEPGGLCGSPLSHPQAFGLEDRA